MKIIFNKSLCAGHGVCAMKAPDVFKLDEDGYLQNDTPEIPETLREDALAGAASCPEKAIALEE